MGVQRRESKEVQKVSFDFEQIKLSRATRAPSRQTTKPPYVSLVTPASWLRGRGQPQMTHFSVAARPAVCGGLPGPCPPRQVWGSQWAAALSQPNGEPA